LLLPGICVNRRIYKGDSELAFAAGTRRERAVTGFALGGWMACITVSTVALRDLIMLAGHVFGWSGHVQDMRNLVRVARVRVLFAPFARLAGLTNP
jgi:hypothetical protein